MTFLSNKMQPDFSRFFKALCLAACLLSVVACGKRPQHVDPPADAQDVRYPRVYPDPAEDPK